MYSLKKPHATLRRTLDSIIRFTSSIGENSVFTGSFSGGENIVVRGTVVGESDVQGTVVVTDTGCWQGRLIADTVIIGGKIKGHVIAREKIEVLKSAMVEGNLQCASIAIETGAVHEGRIIMGEDGTVARFEEKRQSPIDLPRS
jgi:cytoskeletal protein CcmA (bactofilin family)